jgi:CRP/FNR family transcriptional regulator, cyclic AMP receptor protein
VPRKSNPSLVRRFRGASGKQRLAEALLCQPLLSASVTAATAFSRFARLSELPADQQLIIQGGQDNDLYFILSGSVRVLVNMREVATRRAGEHVGEMALIDRTAVRSATAITAEASVVARISEPDFTRVANRHPIIWRKLASTIAQRLRERNRFHPAPRSIPAVFIGSSSESLPIATAIHKSLTRRRVEPRIWSDGVFQCSRATIEDLMAATAQSDFAILVLAADDITISRGSSKAAPRDNTIFELGLFMGALSQDRTYIVAPRPLDIKIPTDLLGVTLLTYQKRRGQSVARAIRPVTRELMHLVCRLGPK